MSGGEERFFILRQDLNEPGLCDFDFLEKDWLLGGTLKTGMFHAELREITLHLVRQGKVRDYMTTVGGIPIVSERAAEVLRSVAERDIQLIPAHVIPAPLDDSLYILNVLHRIDCLDEKNSLISGYRGPKKLGGVIEPSIDESKVKEQRLFRIDSWPVLVIVREAIVQAFTAANLTGARFEATK